MISSISILLVTSILTLLPVSNASAADPKFRRPLNTTASPIYSAHYDDNSFPGKVANYYCGTNTVYDGHQGTDFRASIGTPIYASAAGGLYYRYDNCPTTGYLGSTCGGGYGNHARIDHEGSVTDGSGWVTIYAHMKQGTVVGTQSLLCGKQIGQTGSSGNSSGPHLHFEVRKHRYPGNDPFHGPCSFHDTFWVNQGMGVPMAQCQ